uniref:Uncharacterized protein n=1 Tax=Arundo donax TaxID=35708 RepID=A0A0A9ASZ0_ARUDO
MFVPLCLLMVYCFLMTKTARSLSILSPSFHLYVFSYSDAL